MKTSSTGSRVDACSALRPRGRGLLLSGERGVEGSVPRAGWVCFFFSGILGSWFSPDQFRIKGLGVKEGCEQPNILFRYNVVRLMDKSDDTISTEVLENPYGGLREAHAIVDMMVSSCAGPTEVLS